MTLFAGLLSALALSLLVWTYVLYPLVCLVVATRMREPSENAECTESVSVIVPVHNEADVIERKVLNTMELDFGNAEWELIVVSDGCTDGSQRILEELQRNPALAKRKLIVEAYSPRAGKPHALRRAVARARGSVLILSDANVFLEPNAARALLAPLHDENVGAVCASVRVAASGGEELSGESTYMRFEAMLQRAESRIYSVMGTDGALYALRREHFRALEDDPILDDLQLAMNVLFDGRRVVYQADARAVETAQASSADEYRRKKRIIEGAMQFLARNKTRLLRLGPLPLAMFVSHKVLRWASPLLIMSALLGATVQSNPLSQALVVGFVALLALSALVWAAPTLRRRPTLYMPYYLILVNVAALAGIAHFFSRRQDPRWEKVTR